MRTDGILRPLQIVVPNKETDFRPKEGGGSTTVHGDWTVAQTRLLAGIEQTLETFAESFDEWPRVPAVAKLTLKPEAFAKSHRPESLFREETCPLIGSDGLGEVFVSVTPDGLRKLRDRVSLPVSRTLQANISTVADFQPVLPIFDTGDLSVQTPDTHVIRKVKLFNHVDEEKNLSIQAEFARLLSEVDLVAHELNYGGGLRIFEVDGQLEQLSVLRTFVGMQSLTCFPSYTPVRTQSNPVSWEVGLQLPQPEPDTDYPVVAVVDDGVDPTNPFLSPWIVDRVHFLPDEEIENGHGTFVAGVLVFGRQLNHGDPRFPTAPCKILDVPVFEKGRGLSEKDLVRRLRLLLSSHREVRVVNLSLSSRELCQDDRFSDLAVSLDSIQEEFDVQFVLAAGNYVDRINKWPRQEVFQDCGGSDRVTVPSDSPVAIVVGSIAHVHRPGSAALDEEPSPFTRIGPGPMYSTKPDVAHFGGNTDRFGCHSQVGIISLDKNGGTCESVGTSFAAPIVSAITAHLLHETGDRLMASALLLHSASLARGFNTPDPLRNHIGFGVPTSPERVLECRTYEGTLIFDVTLPAGTNFRKLAFPIPRCLVNQEKLRADWVATLVAEPHLNSDRGAEYIGTDASLSIGIIDKEGHLDGQVPPDRRGDASKEVSLVKDGDKWAPRKSYRRRIPIGTKAKDWAIMMKVTTRSGLTLTDGCRVIAVVTILDPEKSAEVYEDVLEALRLASWETRPMLGTRVRNRP